MKSRPVRGTMQVNHTPSECNLLCKDATHNANVIGYTRGRNNNTTTQQIPQRVILGVNINYNTEQLQLPNIYKPVDS